jgi:hypothetical protein
MMTYGGETFKGSESLFLSGSGLLEGFVFLDQVFHLVYRLLKKQSKNSNNFESIFKL